MIDLAKRKTLKNVAAIGVNATALTAFSGVVHSASNHYNSTSSASRPTDEGLVNIHIGTRQASTTYDLEVVITNPSATDVTITSMTPAEINTARGRFDFNALFALGQLRLDAGESVSVPIQHHAVVLNASSIDERATELTQSLRRSVSIVVNGDSFAAISINKFANFA